MTTTQPATTESRPDTGAEPLFQKDQRVVLARVGGYAKGRHGTIIEVVTTTWRMVAIFGGGEGERGISRHYRVKTDEGYVCTYARADDLEAETEVPDVAIIPDPVLQDGPVTPQELCSLISTAHNAMLMSRVRAQRARVAKSITAHTKEAESQKRIKEYRLSVLDAWCVAHPEGRAKHLETIEGILRNIGMLAPKPRAAGEAGVAGVKPRMSQNEERNGVELRFSEKPDAETLASLKRNGWRWAMRSRCWYTRRSPEALAFAAELAGVDVPAGAPSGPDAVDMAYEDQCAAACGV